MAAVETVPRAWLGLQAITPRAPLSPSFLACSGLIPLPNVQMQYLLMRAVAPGLASIKARAPMLRI